MGRRVPQTINRQRRQYDVLQMKLAGASDRAISDTLTTQGRKVSVATVNKDWHRSLKDLADASTPAADELRALQNERYERLLVTWWRAATQAQNPSPQAAQIGLQIIRHIREINGLDRELGTAERPLTLSIVELARAAEAYEANARIDTRFAPSGDGHSREPLVLPPGSPG